MISPFPFADLSDFTWHGNWNSDDFTQFFGSTVIYLESSSYDTITIVLNDP